MRSLASALGGCRSRLALVALAISFVLAPPAQAQLNDYCVISILNRTAQVQPDGSWRIANVPANFGAVRARATWVENGVTLTGESSLIAFKAGIANGFDAEIVVLEPWDPASGPTPE